MIVFIRIQNANLIYCVKFRLLFIFDWDMIGKEWQGMLEYQNCANSLPGLYYR